VPNPGQPALADVPALASLGAAVGVPPWPLWLGVAALALRRDARRLAPAAVGLAWIGLVAAMAQAGFSGEARYALPGAALIAISGAAGLAAAAWEPVVARVAGLAARRAVVALVVVLVVAGAVPALAALPGLRAEQAHRWALQRDLAAAVRAAGGPDAVLACGRPYVGPYRGPLMAYRLGVAKRMVEPDDRPRPPGVVFRSRLERDSVPAPAAPPGFAAVATEGEWSVLARCRPASS
jgi:hypothetical protein